MAAIFKPSSRLTRAGTRSVFALALSFAASACFATEALRLGELENEIPEPPDAGPPASEDLPAPDAALQTEPPHPSPDAGLTPERDNDDLRERDAGSDDEQRPHDACVGDADLVVDAGTDTSRDAGAAKDAAINDAASDAGGDAARSLLCTFEPWHCL